MTPRDRERAAWGWYIGWLLVALGFACGGEVATTAGLAGLGFMGVLIHYINYVAKERE